MSYVGDGGHSAGLLARRRSLGGLAELWYPAPRLAVLLPLLLGAAEQRLPVSETPFPRLQVGLPGISAPSWAVA